MKWVPMSLLTKVMMTMYCPFSNCSIGRVWNNVRVLRLAASMTQMPLIYVGYS